MCYVSRKARGQLKGFNLAIIAAVLRSAKREPLPISHIMRKANVCHIRTKRLLEFLIEKELIIGECLLTKTNYKGFYYTTKKGRKWLRLYDLLTVTFLGNYR